MVIKENLEVSAERTGDNELEQRFEDIKREIAEVGGVDKSDDGIKISQGALNGQFAEFLLRAENRTAFDRLKQDVSKMRNDWNLGSQAGPKLESLYNFLSDIENGDKMEKDYDEFMEKIQKPKKLNTLKSWEIRRLNLYLGMHEDKALAAYNAMKPIYGKFDENGMKPEDISFFETVWNTLKANYSSNNAFIEQDYPAIKGLEATADSLSKLAVENWDGSDEGLNISKVENSIVDVDDVKEMVKAKNQERIDANREIVKAITIDADSLDAELLSKFTKTEDGELKYEGNDFTVETMMSIFGDQILKAAGEGTSFVKNEAEGNGMIESCKDDIFNNINTVLLAKAQVEVPEEEEDSDEIPVERTYEESKENFKIKMSALKDKIKELEFYDGNEDGEKVKFNIEKVKGYLEGLKDKSWKELEHTNPLDKATWTIAVQIALNYLAVRDGKSDYNVHYVDGIRGNETLKGVRAFQDDNGLKFKNNQPDGLPGKVTIAKLLEVLGGEAVEDDSDSGTDGDKTVIEDDAGAGGGSES